MSEKIILNSKEIIENVILRELKTIIYSSDTATAPYIKFILIANAIEFIGACGDTFPFKENGHSETRFNDALTKYFKSTYKQFAKSSSAFYLYENFRCSMVHAFRPSVKIDLVERKSMIKHLSIDEDNEKLYLVLEDFYDDLEKAAKKIIDSVNKGSISNKQKVESPFLYVDDQKSGSTESNLVQVVSN